MTTIEHGTGTGISFALTDEQKAMRESVRNFVRKEIKPSANERDRLEDEVDRARDHDPLHLEPGLLVLARRLFFGPELAPNGVAHEVLHEALLELAAVDEQAGELPGAAERAMTRKLARAR